MTCKPYVNNFKGRANRRERAKHIRDEFDAIAEAFITLQQANSTTYSTIYTQTLTSETIYEIDPADGIMQEIYLNGPITLTVREPTTEDDDATSKRVSVLLHGSNIRVVNGWGPQTWKEIGTEDWVNMLTADGEYASMLIDFIWDGKAWMAAVASKNKGLGSAPSAVFPLIKDLLSVAGTESITFTRASAGSTFDTNERLWMLPDDSPRFVGSRYVHSWAATANDLQSEAWEEDGATVSTEANGGPTGQDTDKITFITTGGELGCWVLPNFGRSSNTADPIKFLIRFKAKMASASTGSIRVGAAYMGQTDQNRHDMVTVNLTDEWQDYGCVLDYITGHDLNSLDITVAKRTLTKILFKSPSGSLGSPVLVEGVGIEILREDYPEIPSELQETDISASLTLAATAGSTGTWDNGTKAMALDNGEYVDFQDSLEIGKTYLMVCRVVTGTAAKFLLDSERIWWDGSLVKDAPFTFRYNGGAAKWLNGLDPSTYTVNIYEVEDNVTVYDTEIGNALSSSYILTDGVGAPVGTYFVQGLGYEKTASENLLSADKYRSFYNWTKVGLTGLSDPEGKVSSFRGEYGVDGLPCHGTLLQDTMTSTAGYVEETFVIPADTETYSFSLFTRKLFNLTTRLQTILPQYDGQTTLASRFFDIEMIFSGSGTDLTYRKRIDIPRGTIYPVISGVTVTAIDYTNWMRHGMTADNDGTKTLLTVRIYPAVIDRDTDPDLLSTAVSVDELGYIIIDWAQVETGSVSSAHVGGDTRATETFASTLDDGDIYDSNSNLLGDITGNVVTFDADSNIIKNISYSIEAEVTGPSATELHEFGVYPVTCSDTLDDEDGNPILSESESEDICTESFVPVPTLNIGALAAFFPNAHHDPSGIVIGMDNHSSDRHPATDSYLHPLNTIYTEDVTGYNFKRVYHSTQNDVNHVVEWLTQNGTVAGGWSTIAKRLASFAFSASWSIHVWSCRDSAAGGDMCLFNVGTTTNANGAGIYEYPAGHATYDQQIVFQTRSSGGTAYLPWPTKYTAGQLSMKAIRWDAATGEMGLSVDGAPFITLPATPDDPTGTHGRELCWLVEVTISSTMTKKYVGKLGQVGFYDEALSDDDVIDLWNGGMGKDYYQYTGVRPDWMPSVPPTTWFDGSDLLNLDTTNGEWIDPDDRPITNGDTIVTLADKMRGMRSLNISGRPYILPFTKGLGAVRMNVMNQLNTGLDPNGSFTLIGCSANTANNVTKASVCSSAGTSAGNEYRMVTYTSTVDNGKIAYFRPTGGSVTLYQGVGNNPAADEMVCRTVIKAGNTGYAYYNGTLVDSASLPSGTYAADKGTTFGADYNPSVDINDLKHGEFFIFDYVLSDEEREAVEAYLIDKWIT